MLNSPEEDPVQSLELKVETCCEIKVEKFNRAQFIGGYLCNIFNFISEKMKMSPPHGGGGGLEQAKKCYVLFECPKLI